MRARKHERARGLAAELHADDGVDSRTAFSRITPPVEKNARKSLQFCKEAGRALRVALACDFGDPLLNDLKVVAVEPIAGASRLRVTLRQCTTSSTMNLVEVASRVKAVSGFLRAAVASATNRRRAPELCFVVQPPMGGGS